MAFGKAAAVGLILTFSITAAQFPVRHEHLRKGCHGLMTVDDAGIRFTGESGHQWMWRYDDIQRLTLLPDGLRILTYQDRKLRLGADVELRFSGKLPAEELYRHWSAKLDQRLIAEQSFGLEGETLAAKRWGAIQGHEGTLIFGQDAIAWAAPKENRRRRYLDIINISSSSPFQLTLTTFEKQFDFQLKQPLSEDRYNRIWLDLERKNGRLQ